VELQKVVRSAFSQFRRGTQEDAHEFFRTVVDGVDEEHKKKDSFVRELFHLNTTSVVTCHGCQTSFARLEDAFDCSLQLEAPAKKKSNNNNNKKNKNKKKKDVVGEEQEQEHEEAEPVELVTTLWPSFGGKKFPIFVAASFPVFAEERQDCLSAAAVVPVVVARVDVVAGRYDARRQDAEEQKAACPFLRAFSEPEVLSGRDKYFCGKCQRRHDASKQLLLGPKLPRVLQTTTASRTTTSLIITRLCIRCVAWWNTWAARCDLAITWRKKEKERIRSVFLLIGFRKKARSVGREVVVGVRHFRSSVFARTGALIASVNDKKTNQNTFILLIDLCLFFFLCTTVIWPFSRDHLLA
jgi:hypothetical protein